MTTVKTTKQNKMLNSTKKAASLHDEHLDSVFKTNQNEQSSHNLEMELFSRRR